MSPLPQTKKIVQFLAVAALLVSMLDNGVSGTGSVLGEIRSEDAAKVDTNLYYTVAEEAPKESEPKPSSCQCNKDETRKPEAHLALEEKAGASSKAKKSSGKKFRVITISIPVDPESVDSVEASVDEKKVGAGCKGKKLESAGSIPIVVDVKESEEIRENVASATSVEPENDKVAPEEEEEEAEAEEVVEVAKPKKQSKPKQMKSEKKRSKRQATRSSTSDPRANRVRGEGVTKLKGEKKGKGRGKK